MIYLGIETSCDETSIALIKNNKVLANVIYSQIKNHQKYKGVLPELASRLHLEKIDFILKAALNQAGLKMNQVNHIIFTKEPGLPGALQVGKIFAESLGLLFSIPVTGVNHLYGHLFSPFIDTIPQYPFLGLVISGGHTSIYLAKSKKNIKELCKTKDDAAGECFDKVAKMLGLNYPGGPEIEKLAKFTCQYIDAPNPKFKDNSDSFSFSGIKSFFANEISKKKIPKEIIANSLQTKISQIVVNKIIEYAHSYGIKNISISGGVSCNEHLRKEFLKKAQENNLNAFLCSKQYSTDNAAMIVYYGQLK